MKKKQPEENKLAKVELNPVGYKSDNHKKEEFVNLYNMLKGHISNTCDAVGIARQSYYRWLDEDKEFAMAIAESEANLNDEMRDILINKAGSGDMTAVIFYLKNRHPDFKPQPTVLIQNNNYRDVLKEINDN